MKPVIYVSAKLFKVFRMVEVEENPRIPENELIVINSDAAVDAILDDKQQIASGKACVKFVADEENIRQFLKGEVKEGGKDEA